MSTGEDVHESHSSRLCAHKDAVIIKQIEALHERTGISQSALKKLGAEKITSYFNQTASNKHLLPALFLAAITGLAAVASHFSSGNKMMGTVILASSALIFSAAFVEMLRRNNKVANAIQADLGLRKGPNL